MYFAVSVLLGDDTDSFPKDSLLEVKESDIEELALSDMKP